MPQNRDEVPFFIVVGVDGGMNPSNRSALTLAAALLFTIIAAPSLSCGPLDEEPPCHDLDATRARFDPSPASLDDWLAHPFPSNHRLRSGHLVLDGFPNPGQSGLVEDYLFEAADLLDGFGLNTPVYVSFDGPIDATSLPEDPAAYMDERSPIQLVDVDRDSEQRGRRFPLRFSYTDESNGFLPAHTLAVAPAWGAPLRERTTYALVLTRDLIDASGFSIAPDPLSGLTLCGDSRCEPDQTGSVIKATKERLSPVRDLFEEEGGDVEQLAMATVFTTLNATDEVRRMREIIHSLDPPEATVWATFEGERGWLEREYQWAPGEHVSFFVLEGYFESPYFLEGDIPYYSLEDGGGIRIEDGDPAIVRTETLRFALTIPDLPPRAGGCHPIVQYAHGTGGSAHGFTYSTAGRLAGRGLAGIGLDQPLHGVRNDGKSYDVSLLTFNIANVRSTRSLFRQSAADTFSLTRLLKAGLEVPADQSPTGERICFQTEPLLFFGHSQGGITGAIAAAFETDIDSWMLSGSGGGVGITVMERKDPVDMAALLALLGGVDAPETMNELHPLVMLLHTLTETTDPINYAPAWLNDGTDRSFLVTSGELDTATPYATALAKTAAAGAPLVWPAGTESMAHDLAGLTVAVPPVSRNEGGSTAGHIHWPSGDHFVVFRIREAIHASMHFLDTAASGTPIIERDPNASVR